jgi:hypothetical protein
MCVSLLWNDRWIGKKNKKNCSTNIYGTLQRNENEDWKVEEGFYHM